MLSSGSINFIQNVSKASSLQSLALHFVHYLLNCTVIGRNDSTSTVTIQELYYLLSMADNYLYHPGLVLTRSFHHQATNPHVRTIFAGPYITHLIKRMGFLNCVDHMTIVTGYNPINFRNFQKLGLPMASTSRAILRPLTHRS